MLDCVKIDANLLIFSNPTKCEATGTSYLNQAFCLDLYASPICMFVKCMDFDLVNKDVEMNQSM